MERDPTLRRRLFARINRLLRGSLIAGESRGRNRSPSREAKRQRPVPSSLGPQAFHTTCPLLLTAFSGKVRGRCIYVDDAGESGQLRRLRAQIAALANFRPNLRGWEQQCESKENSP